MSKNIVLKPEELRQLARIAKLTLTPEEKEKISAQVSEAIEAVEVLSELDGQSIQPLEQPTNLRNITREDKVEPSLSQKEALSNAKRTYQGYFVTDAILDK